MKKQKRSVFHERIYISPHRGVITDPASVPQINLSVLPIDAILNAYSLTVQLILAIREDMTPEQRKAGWLWLEKIQKQIESAFPPQ